MNKRFSLRGKFFTKLLVVFSLAIIFSFTHSAFASFPNDDAGVSWKIIAVNPSKLMTFTGGTNFNFDPTGFTDNTNTYMQLDQGGANHVHEVRPASNVGPYCVGPCSGASYYSSGLPNSNASPGSGTYGVYGAAYFSDHSYSDWKYFCFKIVSGVGSVVNCPRLTIDVNSDITTSTTWYGTNTYLVSGNVEIDPGVTLTIQPGAVIKFEDDTSGLTVNGTLTANGEPNTEDSDGGILFTSLKDDSFSIDTNGDGGTTTPAAGDWDNIYLGSTGIITFNNVTLRYGGGGTSDAQIYNDGGFVGMTNSTVAYGTTYGIYNSSGTTSISDNSDIGFNDTGIYKDGGTVSIDTSVIHDNTSYGIYNNTVSDIAADHNYWGDPTGPYHNSSNLSGLGNSVSDNVTFYPWNGVPNYTSNYLHSEFCADYNECTSVYDDELHWKNVNVSSYGTQLSAAIATWENLGSGLTFVEDNSTPTLEINQTPADDVSWKGKWEPRDNPDSITLDSYYLTGNTSDQIQNTITHELGHAIGLDHSYTGNVMYFNQSSQTMLGPQDQSDYDSLWP